MPGFVDVSNMSDIEIKRLGQIDDAGDAWSDPYAYRNLANRNPYAYRRPMNRVAKPNISFKAEDVWAAAWQAYVMNGKQYIKAIMPDVPSHKTNRMIAEGLLTDVTQLTQESRDNGEAMRRYFQTLTFKLIEGKQLSSFMQSAFNASNKDEFTNKLDLAIVISLPATYEKACQRDIIERRIKWAQGGYLGAIGQKVEVNIEVVKQVWSQKWNTWYITGMTESDQVLFFAYKNQELKIGDCVTIQGTVKGTRDNSTQLNRVKVIK